MKASKTISPKALQLFADYDWPGNVRELANVVERAVILSRGNCIEPNDLPFAGAETCRSEYGQLKDLEKNHILKVLQSTSGNKTQAAKMLGISVRNLYRKMEQYGVMGNANPPSSSSFQF